MANRVNDILSAIVALLTGLTTTGDNIELGRVDEIPEGKTTYLSVYRGENREPEPDVVTDPVAYWWVVINVDIHASAKTIGEAELLLGTVESEVIIALMQDLQIGLPYVHKIQELGATEPERDGAGTAPVTKMTKSFAVQYRRSITNPGA